LLAEKAQQDALFWKMKEDFAKLREEFRKNPLPPERRISGKEFMKL
jgi:hypothetical protein